MISECSSLLFVHVCWAIFLSPPDSRLFSIFNVDILFYVYLPLFPPVLPDYTGSEENIDISVLGLQSKLNLPLKTPPSHNHKPEAYRRRPGYNYSEQIHVDGGYPSDGLCLCVCVCIVCVCDCMA